MKSDHILPSRRSCLAILSAFCVCLFSTIVVATSFSDPRPTAGPLRAEEPIRPIPEPVYDHPLRIALGEALFNDPRLSHDGRRACVSCHDTKFNGADAQARDRSPDGQPVATNTNTVFNAALSFRLDWIGDARTLQEQAALSLQRSDLMASTFPEVIGRLRADPAMTARFREAFNRDPDRDALLDALAAYEQTLLTPDSPFDLWLRGQNGVLSADAIAGYKVFKSAGCIACHQGVNVGGNLFEKNGIFGRLVAGDPHLMRVPSLRNVAVTPPYFHDGSAGTLTDAVRAMARAQLGRTLDDRQVSQIVAFLGSLTGKYKGRPVAEPRS